MQTELKPCPFCGSEEVGIAVSDVDGMEAYTVACTHCMIGIFKIKLNEAALPFVGEEEAAEAWNRRANDGD